MKPPDLFKNWEKGHTGSALTGASIHEMLLLQYHIAQRIPRKGGLGTMGYGLPAGIGAKIGNPETDVVVVTGDGGMQMNIQELATAVVFIAAFASATTARSAAIFLDIFAG